MYLSEVKKVKPVPRYFSFLVCIVLIFSCKSGHENHIKKVLPKISVDTILEEKISIRAILATKNRIWYAADEGRYGFYDISAGSKSEFTIPDFPKTEFRSIAATSDAVFILNAGSPAVLYKIGNDAKPVLVYRENDPKAFYDSMAFWDDREGIAIGDPTQDCLSILLTSDGGNSWKKIQCDKLPAVSNGEAAFAASNTNIVVKGNMAWIFSGGKKSRVFFSPDKGKTWSVNETPIVQGSAMTGIFTGDFYDDRNGFIAGGDYEKPNLSTGNKAITSDGGKTWRPVAGNSGFGYASCVQYIPESKGKCLVSVGATGVWYSSDAAQSWTKLLDDKSLYTIRFYNKNTAFAAGKNKIIRISLKK
jgi:photosystem II stability/assembly factor-like uncharacterized protein